LGIEYPISLHKKNEKEGKESENVDPPLSSQSGSLGGGLLNTQKVQRNVQRKYERTKNMAFVKKRCEGDGFSAKRIRGS